MMTLMRNHNHATGHLLVLFTILIWGTTFVSTKVLLVDFTPVEILLFRFLIGYLILDDLSAPSENRFFAG